MKKAISLLLCMLLMLAAVQTAVTAAATDTAASGAGKVYLHMYLDPDSQYPTASGERNMGEAPFRPDDPDRSDYGLTFIDWYTSPSFTVRFDFSRPLYEDVDIYARFVENDQVVGVNVFDSPSADYPVYGQLYAIGDYVETPPSPELAEDQNLLGWYSDRALKNEYDFSQPISDYLNLFPKIVADEDVCYGALYIGADDAEPVAYITVVKGEYCPYPEAPGKDGMEFMGWYNDRALKEKMDFSKPVYEDFDLFPKFVSEDDLCTGSLYLSTSHTEPTVNFYVVKGELIPVPAEPGRPGEDFTGWFFDRALTKPVDFTKPVYEDFDLFPKFVPSHSHKLIEVGAIRATATTDGMKAHFECEGCGKWFEPTYTALIEIEDHDSLIIPARGPYLIGDADGSGEVDIIDATVVQRKLAGMAFKGGFCRDAADADRDEDLSIVDATAIQRFDADMPVPFPINTYYTPILT